MRYKVLITASGTGSRLGELTKRTNKALVPINGRPSIEYILDSYAPEVPLVITVGYLGEQLVDYIIREHPDRKVEFVRVDVYEGPGSSLGYSMLCAERLLQCPLIFHACDTIVVEPVPPPDHDWIGGFKATPATLGDAAKQYRTHKIEQGRVVRVNDKGVLDFESVHIGLVGFHDYLAFWSSLHSIRDENAQGTALSDVHVIDALLKGGKVFSWVPYVVWLDTGNPESLKRTESYFISRL